MRNCALALVACAASLLHAQHASLIFHSGFEPATVLVDANGDADIIGADGSLPPPNNWVSDLEASPYIGFFNIQYQGGNDTMRRAEIVPDPGAPANHVLSFWLK